MFITINMSPDSGVLAEHRKIWGTGKYY